mmetsp:Transcript_1491/g.2629  ORF Transcript_1491/g.2629 Transcript_1491/m.2629 type:complete len:107 (-) Transcript_1491:92-412(-)
MVEEYFDKVEKEHSSNQHLSKISSPKVRRSTSNTLKDQLINKEELMKEEEERKAQMNQRKQMRMISNIENLVKNEIEVEEELFKSYLNKIAGKPQKSQKLGTFKNA